MDQIWACGNLGQGRSSVAGSRLSEAGLMECRKLVGCLNHRIQV